MKPEDWDVLAGYLRSVADAIGLRDWDLLLKHDPPLDEEVLASVSATYGRRHATVRVCLEFRELTATEQRMAIVHELVHCHHATLGHILNRSLKEALGNAGELLMVAVNAEFEHLVDAIASEWATRMPFIEWTTPDPGREEMVQAPYEGPIDQAPPA